MMPLWDWQGPAPRQSGFTLVELMVALAVGLIILLGAGQLLLMSFQTFRQIELMSNKQAALTFATETLVRDIRRSDTIAFNSGKGELKVEFPNNGDTSACSARAQVERIYRLSSRMVSAKEGWSLDMGQRCLSGTGGMSFEPLVTSFMEGGFSAEEVIDGVWVIRFWLMANRDGSLMDEFEFRAVNRNQAVK
ncbi:prepilin-type N-terminal cleavage/methylation domain-containing protein [Halomonas sp. MCCC 1A11057]|nr:prepilin-type N-terminal cleavage/methylation domain-containing protein [Halomonas sp. MCCC 1A11057]